MDFLKELKQMPPLPDEQAVEWLVSRLNSDRDSVEMAKKCAQFLLEPTSVNISFSDISQWEYNLYKEALDVLRKRDDPDAWRELLTAYILIRCPIWSNGDMAKFYLRREYAIAAATAHYEEVKSSTEIRRMGAKAPSDD